LGTFSQSRAAAEDFRIPDGPVRLDVDLQADGPTDPFHFEGLRVYYWRFLENLMGGILCVAGWDAREHDEKTAELPAGAEPNHVFTSQNRRMPGLGASAPGVNNSPCDMLQTMAHGATCLNRILEFDNSQSWAPLIHWILWTFSSAGVRSRTLDLRGSPVARQRRLIALFQIEKNFSKEVSNRGREEGDQVAAWLVALSGVWFWGDSICPVCAFIRRNSAKTYRRTST
jgi:hypothetical protein